MTPAIPKAMLVESSNRILISQVTLPGFTRGIDVFIEKPDLLPFEEAKLYGHNAIHALIAYLAAHRGLTTMSDAAAHPEIMAAARAAFLDESGAALFSTRRFRRPLFTQAGYAAYADDLLAAWSGLPSTTSSPVLPRPGPQYWDNDDRFLRHHAARLQYGISPGHPRPRRGGCGGVMAQAMGFSGADRRGTAAPGQPAHARIVGQLLRAIWSRKPARNAATLTDLTCWRALMSQKANQGSTRR